MWVRGVVVMVDPRWFRVVMVVRAVVKLGLL
jgi:hypothetical protein